jgi:hypothetical protein
MLCRHTILPGRESLLGFTKKHATAPMPESQRFTSS